MHVIYLIYDILNFKNNVLNCIIIFEKMKPFNKYKDCNIWNRILECILIYRILFPKKWNNGMDRMDRMSENDVRIIFTKFEKKREEMELRKRFLIIHYYYYN